MGDMVRHPSHDKMLIVEFDGGGDTVKCLTLEDRLVDLPVSEMTSPTEDDLKAWEAYLRAFLKSGKSWP